MRDSSRIIISKDMVILYGKMGNSIKDSGRTTKCMEKEILFGKMGESLMGSI